ncbi:aldo/keto reductase [Geodermatophilus sp. SYSU D00684]
MSPWLGVGTGGLMGRLGRADSTAILRAAAESGYRHVDTARAYGGGQAERVVGAVLARFPADATVATKLGLGPLSAQTARGAARAVGRPVLRTLRPRRPVPAAPPSTDVDRDRGVFSVAAAERSLRLSERQLRRQPDCLLLHQVHPDDLTADLVALLRSWKQSGRVRALGTATSRGRTAAIVEAGILPLDVVQVAGGPLLPALPDWPVPTVVHSLFGPGGSWLRDLHDHLLHAPGASCGPAMTRRELGSALIELTARTSRSCGVILSSSTPEGVRRNAESFRGRSMTGSELDDLAAAVDDYRHGRGGT